MPNPTLGARLAAEFVGTFWLVFAGCGSAVLSAKYLSPDDQTQLGIGFVGVALAFGLSVLTMAYAVGHISGGHFNPAVTFGLAVAKRADWKAVGPYVITQIVAATVAGQSCSSSPPAGPSSTPPRRASPPTATATAPPAATHCWHAWSRRSS
jgi:aquaporin Z